jgi:hypothetical protein
VSGAFEGDLIRPLGLVTLYFGYVEAQVNLLLSMLRENGAAPDVSPIASLGLRLKEFEAVALGFPESSAAEILGLLEESKAR